MTIICHGLFQSDSCGFQVPELDFELLPGTLGGKFTTVEGLLDKVQDQVNMCDLKCQIHLTFQVS